MKYLLSYNESVRDLMKGKSEEDILKSLKQESKKHRNELFYYECVRNRFFDINKLKLLLKTDIDINFHDEYGGNTRLMDASAIGNYDAVDLLIKHGADINVRNDYGKTALYIAIANKRNDIVDLLKKHGAKE